MEHRLIYDDTCPLCKAYTGAFVKFRLLDEKGRISFSELKEQDFVNYVDWKKAKNEIPLIDLKEKKVYYGVEALLRILGNKIIFFKWFAKHKFLVNPAKKLYKFISLNRRIIIPAKENKECNFNAAPDFNAEYRSYYLLFAWLITSLILTSYSSLLTKFIGAPSAGREFLVCGGQMLFQLVFLFSAKKKKEEIFEYLGNMMTISLGGALLLFPLLIIGKIFTTIPPVIFPMYFLFVAGLMLLEHLRRMKITGLPKWLSATWVLYRVLVLIVILGLEGWKNGRLESATHSSTPPSFHSNTHVNFSVCAN